MARVYVGSIEEVRGCEVASYRPCDCRACRWKLDPTHWKVTLADVPWRSVLEHARPGSFDPPLPD